MFPPPGHCEWRRFTGHGPSPWPPHASGTEIPPTEAPWRGGVAWNPQQRGRHGRPERVAEGRRWFASIEARWLRTLCQKMVLAEGSYHHSRSTMRSVSHIERLLRHMKRHRVVRTRDLEKLGVPRGALKRAADRGQVTRWARGVYVSPDHAVTRHTDIAAVGARTPKAVICLVSALEYHGMTTQVPHAVWIMIHKSAHRPTSSRWRKSTASPA